MTHEEKALFVRLFDETLTANASQIVRAAFGSTSATVSRVDFRNIGPIGEVRVTVREFEKAAWHLTVLAQGTFGHGSGERRDVLLHLAQCLVFADQRSLFAYAERHHKNRSPLFLPASRTGFMLLYKGIVSGLINRLAMVDEASAPLRLTLPAVRLLNLLAVGLTGEPGEYGEDAAFLEKELGGRIALEARASGVGVNEYAYHPSGSEARLDMSLSSSIVTELAPIILVLRHVDGFPILVLEEPEAHLHPTMQRHLARTIVRLIRKGLFVWITTHSEDFCQQINNFMKLGAHPRRAEMQAKYNYREDEYLTVDDVAGYQFVREANAGGRTVVRQLKKTPQGLVMPTFNVPLAELTDEAIDLDDTEDDA